LNITKEDVQKIQETPCLFCPNRVRYVIDFSQGIVSPRPEVRAAEAAREAMRTSAKM
jgi:hypothetical protein